MVHAANDRQQVEPVLEQPGQLSDALGKAGTLLADSGHFSEANVEACAEARTAPLIALGSLWGASAIIFPGSSALPHQRRARTTRQPWRRWCIGWQCRKACALRKQTPEPAFAIIKSVMGLRQFNLRGLDKAKGEWNLLTLAWNMKRMFALKPA